MNTSSHKINQVSGLNLPGKFIDRNLQNLNLMRGFPYHRLNRKAHRDFIKKIDKIVQNSERSSRKVYNDKIVIFFMFWYHKTLYIINNKQAF